MCLCTTGAEGARSSYKGAKPSMVGLMNSFKFLQILVEPAIYLIVCDICVEYGKFFT